MKRSIGAVLAMLWLSASVSVAGEAPSRPPGVTAENWVAVSDRLGIVLVQPIAPTDRAPRGPVPNQPGDNPLLLKPPMGGYFMVKVGSSWTRLVIVEPIKGPGDVG